MVRESATRFLSVYYFSRHLLDLGSTRLAAAIVSMYGGVPLQRYRDCKTRVLGAHRTDEAETRVIGSMGDYLLIDVWDAHQG